MIHYKKKTLGGPMRGEGTDSVGDRLGILKYKNSESVPGITYVAMREIGSLQSV